MAEEPTVVRGINWRETFPWTHLFRTFRVAVHPSKLLLGLALLFLVYAGGRILDAIWPGDWLAVPNEIQMFQRAQDRLASRGAAAATPTPAMPELPADTPDNFLPEALRRNAGRMPNPTIGNLATFGEARQAARDQIVSDYAQMLLAAHIPQVTDLQQARAAAADGKYLAEVKASIINARTQDVIDANKVYETAANTPEARRAAAAARDQSIRAAYADARMRLRQAQAIDGRGVFMTFFDYEISCVNRVVDGVVATNWAGPNGVVASIRDFVMVAPNWLMREHTVFCIIFAVWFLLIWSIFGGAIARIAAVHVARDEKLSMRQALKFSLSKTLSFGFAPLIPVLIVLAIGALVAMVALLGNIPWIGPIFVGIPFILALGAGFVMALVLIGLFGGFNLMYPTIAVEGSDSFDAISRSFSYVYARPWRMLWYTAVAVFYVAITYLFVRIFVWLTLVLTHAAVGLGFFRYGNNALPMWQTMWPAPDYLHLPFQIDFTSLNSGASIGAWFVALWVYIVMAMLGAYALSAYFSANTIIYYLMRREVDATEMDDVYVEQIEEEFAEGAPAEPGAATTTQGTQTTVVTAEQPTDVIATPPPAQPEVPPATPDSAPGTPSTAPPPPAAPEQSSPPSEPEQDEHPEPPEKP
jgi:hypothetical protein